MDDLEQLVDDMEEKLDELELVLADPETTDDADSLVAEIDQKWAQIKTIVTANQE